MRGRWRYLISAQLQPAIVFCSGHLDVVVSLITKQSFDSKPHMGSFRHILASGNTSTSGELVRCFINIKDLPSKLEFRNSVSKQLFKLLKPNSCVIETELFRYRHYLFLFVLKFFILAQLTCPLQ